MHYFANIAASLYALLYKEATWHWTDPEQFAMHSLCNALCTHFVLALPNFTKPFQIESDAPNTAVCSVLIQEHASVCKPIAFLSKTLSSIK